MFDAFNKLGTVEQRLDYLDETFTPIVTEAIREYQIENNLPGTITKDIFFDDPSGYGAYYELGHAHRCLIRVMLYSDPNHIMQNYYWVHLYVPWLKDTHTNGLSKEELLNTLHKLRDAAEKEARGE